MTTPVLEKCARALTRLDAQQASPDDSSGWDYFEDTAWPKRIPRARAVLTALLEPDEGMVEAMQESFPHYALDQDFRAAFTAAIQHILKGEGNV